MQSRSYLDYMRHSAQRPWISLGASILVLFVLGFRLLDRLQAPHKVTLPLIGLLLCWLAWEMYRGISQFWTANRGGFDRAHASYLGLGLALLGACGILLRLTGGLYSPFYPLLYLTLAFLASIGTARQGALWFGYAFLLEFVALLATGIFYPGVVGLGSLHLMFFALFAGAHHVFVHGMLREAHDAGNRKRSAEHHKSHIAETQAPAYTGADMAAISIASLDQDRQATLARLKEGLDAHGCALLWLDQDGDYVEVLGIETDAAYDVGPFPAHTGITASLFRGESPLRLSRSGENALHLPYYNHDVQARAWLAVPIRQGQRICGALCVDRIHPSPFSAREEAVLEATATIFARAIESEQSVQRNAQDFAYLNQLNDIGQILGEANTLPILAEVSLELAHAIVPFDWGMLTRVHYDSPHHTVLSTTEEAAYLFGQTFNYQDSLFSLVTKHKCILPERGMIRTTGPLIATPEDAPLPEKASLSIIPLLHQDETIACLILGSRNPDCFADQENEKKLAVFAQQLASAFANVESQQQLERLSHNDSLTGLTNHSAFMEGLTHSFAACLQSSPPQPPPQQALLMFNIDNFRYINERYGHITGDQVLRRIGHVLQKLAAPGDIVARYSGEEIAFLCKGFSLSDALKYADQICHELSTLEICSCDVDPEVFTLTVSAGLACSPEHAAAPDTLLRHAIEALLQAKQRGGNQAVLYANSADGVALATPNPDARPSVLPPQGWGWGSLPPLENPQELQDPERWSLSSFPPSSKDQHKPQLLQMTPSASQPALRPVELPPAPIPVPMPQAAPIAEDTAHSRPIPEKLPSIPPEAPQEAFGPAPQRLLRPQENTPATDPELDADLQDAPDLEPEAVLVNE